LEGIVSILFLSLLGLLVHVSVKSEVEYRDLPSVLAPPKGIPLPGARNNPSPVSPVGGSAISNDPRLVSVLYAANRDWKEGDNGGFGYRRTTKLQFGVTEVRIPDKHDMGVIERPGLIFFGITLWGNADNDKESFQLKSIIRLSEDGFVDAINSATAPTVLVFVPGFNTSFEDAAFRLGQIVFDMQYTGSPILFSWPSKPGGAFDYDYDRESAMFSRQPFLELLEVIQTAGVKQIYVVAHSMGNEIVVDALDQATRMKVEIRKLSEIVLAAPDVDKDVFLKIGPALKEIADGVTLYASGSDKALLASMTKAQGPRAGQLYDGAPILVPGIESVDATSLGSDMFALNHSVYASNRSAIGDISRIITTGIHPPNKRSSEIRPVPEGSANPTYWRFPQ
jgi:esterase/lipase superfamily enzyme